MSTKRKKQKEPCPLEGVEGQLMIMAAMRYCLGRRTYIVSACVSWLRRFWNKAETQTRITAIRDIVESLQDECTGSDCDTRDWLTFAQWAYEQLEPAHQQWVKDAVAYRNKPWPLQ